MIVLSPRAVERLLSFTPDRPLPKVFRMVNKGKRVKDQMRRALCCQRDQQREDTAQGVC